VPLAHNSTDTNRPLPTSTPRVARSSGSRHRPAVERLRTATKYRAKLQLATSMKSTAMASSSGDWKWPKLASYEDSPPRLTVVNMCMSASSGRMPPHQ
jgi:hypothetical protein